MAATTAKVVPEGEEGKGEGGGGEGDEGDQGQVRRSRIYESSRGSGDLDKQENVSICFLVANKVFDLLITQVLVLFVILIALWFFKVCITCIPVYI